MDFSWTRRSLAIFFGNALPSFIVVLANLLSIKVIYFSKSLKYLKQSTRKNYRKRRLQNDLRAFLVILIESFSVIMISWGIPIFLTMYHCRTLYVIMMPNCPRIKDYLALFLFTDLFNSSTNCLLYSLSGKLFRRKFISVIKTFLTCGYGTLWHRKRNLSQSLHQPLDRQPSNNPSINTINNNNYNAKQSSRPGSYHLSERVSSPIINNSNKKLNQSIRTTVSTYQRTSIQNRNVSDDGSLSMGKISDDHHNGQNSISDIEVDTIKKFKDKQLKKSSQTFKLYLIDKVRSFNTTNHRNKKKPLNSTSTKLLNLNKRKVKQKKSLLNTILNKRNAPIDVSLSSSSVTGSFSHGSQRKHSLNTHYSASKVILCNTIDNLSLNDNNNIHENLTSL